MFKLGFFMVDVNAQLKFMYHEYLPRTKNNVSIMQFEKLENSIGDLVIKRLNFVPTILHMIINKQINETNSFVRVRYNSKIRGNNIYEFILFRDDREKEVKYEIENASLKQANENDTFFFNWIHQLLGTLVKR
jgi:hypothetical protein